ncbi:hypothetical protein A1O1_06181 [Capronia coronata CBS 617.96]|uniref:DUF1917 domain-containing protein n=1 Tax=Capronia coronata CBS 617.96 TaxID=1182541 RepID=W9XZ37_9EURO|nr:uncharacterized protein A1O1_06181 [Capronia coronata CBS 617.96]EXJ85812.1 hypothetical protein A1O1_06181 [Capronia coronata CBS 617.96]
MPQLPPTQVSDSTAEGSVSIPDDLISEESDFYGDPGTRSIYQKLAERYSPETYWAIHEWNAQVVAVRGRRAQKLAAKLRAKQDAEKRAKAEAEAASEQAGHGNPVHRRTRTTQPAADQEQDEDEVKVQDEEATLAPSLPSLDPMDLDPAPQTLKNTSTTANTSNGNDINNDNENENVGTDNDNNDLTSDTTLQPQNYYEGMSNAKQLSESVTDFLARLPPSTTTISTAGGPWIWIANPYPDRTRDEPAKKSSLSNDSKRKRDRANVPDRGDIYTFKQLGFRILETYTSRKRDLEAEYPDKPPGSITRMLRPERMQLEPAILKAAQTTNVTCGKWMLFPAPEDVDRLWAIVAHGTWEGKLGVSAKVAVAETEDEDEEHAEGKGKGEEQPEDREGGGKGSNDNGQKGRQDHHRLICVYTYDFTDKADVRRVLLGMKELGLLDNSNPNHASGFNHTRTKYGSATSNANGYGNRGGRGGYSNSNSNSSNGLITIYYKSDAYTYLDLANGNEYRLKASMYCSKDFLG